MGICQAGMLEPYIQSMIAVIMSKIRWYTQFPVQLQAQELKWGTSACNYIIYCIIKQLKATSLWFTVISALRTDSYGICLCGGLNLCV